MELFSLLWGMSEIVHRKIFSKRKDIKSRIENNSYKGYYLENWGEFKTVILHKCELSECPYVLEKCNKLP